MRSRERSFEAELAALLLSFPVIFVVGAMAEGYALSVLWGWFIVPTFDLPPLSIPVALGISLIVGFLAGSSSEDDRDYSNKSVGYVISIAFTKAVTKPLLALAVGWLIQLFI